MDRPWHSKLWHSVLFDLSRQVEIEYDSAREGGVGPEKGSQVLAELRAEALWFNVWGGRARCE